MGACEGFTDEQRRELRADLKLLPEQIAEIESVALPTMRAMLRRQPAKNDVLAELNDVSKALQTAEKAILGLMGANLAFSSNAKEVLPKDGALARVLLASFEAEMDGDGLDRALLPLSAAIHVVEKAKKLLPPIDTSPDSVTSLGWADRKGVAFGLFEGAWALAGSDWAEPRQTAFPVPHRHIGG